MSEGTCRNCGGFVGEAGKPYGYAGKWCHCAKPEVWRSKLPTLQDAFAPPQQSLPWQCGCVGPQNGQPLCPCAMRGVIVKGGRYVRPEQDLGPAAPTTGE